MPHIGETIKRLEEGKTEHFEALSKDYLHSALAKHITGTGHRIKWDNFEILARGENDKQCSVKETMFISECRPSLNGNTVTEKLSLY